MLRPHSMLPPAPLTSALQIASYYPGLGLLSLAATAYSVQGMLPPIDGRNREAIKRGIDFRSARLGAMTAGVSAVERRGLRPRGR